MAIPDFKYFLIFLFCLKRIANAEVYMVDMQCKANPSYCKDPICILNRTVDRNNPQLAHITVGCTLIKDVPKMMGKIRAFLKMKNKYISVGNNMNVELNFCKVSTILDNPILTTFVPKMVERVAAYFHACPYTGVFRVENFAFDGQKIRAIPGWNDIRTEISFFRGNYVSLLTLDFYVKAY